MFRNIECEKIEIKVDNDKYQCNFIFSRPKFRLPFNFNDLNFLERDEDFLKTSSEIILSNFSFEKFEQLLKYTSNKKIKLESITINTIEEFKKFNEMNIDCLVFKCTPNFIDSLEKNYSSDIVIKESANFGKLNLSYGERQTLNLLSYGCLSNLKELNLSYNKIEDISFLTEENIKCKQITKVNLSENPVRKGFEVLNKKFFTDRYLYIEVFNVIKKNDEYFISLNFKDPLWDSYVIKSNDKKFGFKEFYLDIYLKDLNHLWNYIDKKYTFFSYNLPLLHEQDLIKKDEYYLKFDIFAFLSNLPEFFHTLHYDRKIKDSLLNFSELLFDKGYYFLNELFLINLMDHDYDYDYDNSVEIHFNSLCDYSFENSIDFKSQECLELSNILTNDVKFLGGVILLSNLRILKICNKCYIQNLCQLKNAKFVNLEELYLSNDDLENLNIIEIDKYPFENLKILDLSRNKINKIEPILHFKNLRELNLSYNKVFPKDAINLIDTFKCIIDLRGTYAYHSGNKDKFVGKPNVLY